MVGDRLAAGTGTGVYVTKPIPLDDRRVVVGTPRGLLLCVETADGRSEAIHEFRSPITSLRFREQDRRLVVGCEDGTFLTGSVEAFGSLSELPRRPALLPRLLTSNDQLMPVVPVRPTVPKVRPTAGAESENIRRVRLR